MFFDALSSAYLGGFRAFYVFCPVFTDFREVLQKLNSGSTLPKTRRQAADSMSSTARRANAVFWQRKPLWLDVAKDKVVSRRQTMQYGKARSTQQRRILTKEGAIFRGGALKPFIYKGSRGDYPQTPYPRGFRRGVSGDALFTRTLAALLVWIFLVESGVSARRSFCRRTTKSAAERRQAQLKTHG